MLRTTNVNKLVFLLMAWLMLIVVACSPTEPDANVNNTALPDDNGVVVEPVGENDAAATDPIDTTNTTDEAVNYGGLPELPAIGAAGASGGAGQVDMPVSESAVGNGVAMGGGADMAYGRGGGGGGGFGYGSYYGMLPFADTDFNLQAELPTGPAAANVWQSPANISLTIEQAREIAQQYGFTGELYLDYYNVNSPTPSPAGEGDIAPDVYQAPTVYYAFDDTRMLTIYGADVNYTDLTANTMVGPMEYMPYEQALPIVEAFLSERGLLDFEYVARKNYWGLEVQIFRLVDGREVVNPDFTVTVNQDGVIAYLYQTRLNQVGTAAEYPLISAAAAWELLQQGVDYSRIYYNIYPQLDENGMPLPVEPVTTSSIPTQSQYYPRQYQDGEIVELYPYLMAYLPAEGTGAPRIQGDQFRFLASDDVLQELVGYVGQQLYVTGTIVQVAPNVVALQVTSWEPTTDYPEYRYEAGVLNWDESGQAVFTADVGLTWILPNAPTEIESGTRVFVNGWLPPGTAETAPQAFNWQTIEKMQAGIPGVEAITINKVDMVYTFSYGVNVVKEGSETPMNIMQPAWRFTGTTSQGETIEIFVQAVDPSFVNQ